MQKDLSFFYAIPLLLSIIFWMYDPRALWGTLLIFTTVVLIDSGHVYTTIWRTYALKEERKRFHYYWLVPLLVFVVASLWALLKIPYLWSAVVYFTYYHHIRQFQGISKWYMKLNGHFRKVSIYFLYSLTLIPFVVFHFRPTINLYLYSSNDLFFLNMPEALQVGSYILMGGWFLWLLYEFRVYWKENNIEWNRVLSILIPAAIHVKCFLFSSSVEEIIFPLLLIHGISYMAIMAHSMQKLRAHMFSSFQKALCLVVVLGGLLAVVETFGLGELINTDNSYLANPKWHMKILIGLYVTPTITHYILDAYIWKKDHPGFQKILS